MMHEPDTLPTEITVPETYYEVQAGYEIDLRFDDIKFADGEVPEGKPRTRGTYDCTPEKIVHLTFDNCRQTVDILDGRYWGVMGSNHCRGVVMRDCVFSRFDTHTGAYNITISGCIIS